MSVKANQIKVTNDKLVIGGQVNGVDDVGKAMGSHANSQVTFSVDNTGTAGIKLLLKDNIIKGAGNSGSTTSQIEAGSIDTLDVADNAIETAKIDDDAVTNAKILGADGATVSTTFNYSGITSFSVPTPTADGHAATKKYVDDSAQGLEFKDSCDVATTANLSATYDGTGFTLTNNVTQEALAIDGETLSVGKRVLVKNQTTASQNGLYSVTTLGSASSNWVLTRTVDFNEDSEVVAGAYVLVTEGTDNGLTAFVLQSNSGANPTLDTNDLNFVAFSGSATDVLGGDGISVAGGTTVQIDRATSSGLEFTSNKLAINPHANSIEINGSDELAVKLGGTASLKSLEYDSTDAGLAVKVNNSSVKIGTSGLKAAVIKGGANTASRNSVTGNSVGDSGITMTGTPADDSMVFVFINGVMMLLGDGDTANADVFFLPSTSTNTADVRAIVDIVNGDKLYFAANVAGFDLENSDDVRILVQSIPS